MNMNAPTRLSTPLQRRAALLVPSNASTTASAPTASKIPFTATKMTTRAFHRPTPPEQQRMNWSTTFLTPAQSLPSLSVSSQQPQQQQQHQQRRSLFIQTATTPNPESLKFIPNGRRVLGHNSKMDTAPTADLDRGTEIISPNNDGILGEEKDTNGVYLTRKDHVLIARSPLAKLLFHLDPGVKSIYLGYDFLTVTKYAEAHWQHLQTPIFGAIMDFYASGV